MLRFSDTFLISQLDSLPLITLSNVRQLRLLPDLRIVHRSRSTKCLALLPALRIVHRSRSNKCLAWRA